MFGYLHFTYFNTLLVLRLYIYMHILVYVITLICINILPFVFDYLYSTLHMSSTNLAP